MNDQFNVWEIQPTRETTTSSSMIKEDLEEVTVNGLSVMEEMGIKITLKKRFNIVKSKLVKNAHVIEDEKKQFTFPTLVGDKRSLIGYERALNKLSKENNLLKMENYGLQDGLDFYQEENAHLVGEISNLEYENAQLKEEVENLHEQLAHFLGDSE